MSIRESALRKGQYKLLDLKGAFWLRWCRGLITQMLTDSQKHLPVVW